MGNFGERVCVRSTMETAPDRICSINPERTSREEGEEEGWIVAILSCNKYIQIFMKFYC